MGSKEYNVAIVGVTGAVGKIFLSILEERKFPVKNLFPLASHRSAGKKIIFNGEELEVKELNKNSFTGVDIAFFSAGASTSREFAKYAVNSGTVVIDNSSAFRMEEDVPLIVPEINKNEIFRNNGIIANPNCSTIIMVVAIKPIYDLSPVRRIVVSTYQSVSGAGARAIAELENQTRDIICEGKKDVKCEVFPVQIAFNVIPHVDVFLDNGYTKEEMKMVDETRKIFNDNEIMVSATTVRVPVFTSHSESVWVETRDRIELDAVKKALASGEGLILKDDFRNAVYPTALDSSGQDSVFVGRVREDISTENGITMWVVGDQLRKGAALNAIQIAEELIGRVR
ncbi:MAG: aspartate-semialdehyde dehydrogenase [Candidatus Humimicrobiaceae bacterium]|jgi:aspartate-semialdehyde dehydrogenase|nr:aspartate-semialdehyde dehydrogenase [Actinomycetota bacterium]MDY0027710.1 aspartate-semialdehyde dehydrogenase [Candidatus Humimicrobiaceae bacterium]